jgi:hypothetical protein
MATGIDLDTGTVYCASGHHVRLPDDDLVRVRAVIQSAMDVSTAAEDASDLRPGHLPGVLRQIAEQTGMATAIALARAWGGEVRSIPRHPGPDHPLSRLVGHPQAEIIARLCAGPKVLIPSASTVLRWAAARRLRRQGMTFAAIGKAIGVTAKRAAVLCAGAD